MQGYEVVAAAVAKSLWETTGPAPSIRRTRGRRTRRSKDCNKSYVGFC